LFTSLHFSFPKDGTPEKKRASIYRYAEKGVFYSFPLDGKCEWMHLFSSPPRRPLPSPQGSSSIQRHSGRWAKQESHSFSFFSFTFFSLCSEAVRTNAVRCSPSGVTAYFLFLSSSPPTFFSFFGRSAITREYHAPAIIFLVTARLAPLFLFFFFFA